MNEYEYNKALDAIKLELPLRNQRAIEPTRLGFWVEAHHPLRVILSKDWGDNILYKEFPDITALGNLFLNLGIKLGDRPLDSSGKPMTIPGVLDYSRVDQLVDLALTGKSTEELIATLRVDASWYTDPKSIDPNLRSL